MNLLSLHFWFNLRPGSLTPFFAQSLNVFLFILLVATFVFKFLEKKNKKSLYLFLYINLFYFSISNLVIGGLIKFFNYELVPFFSSRFWFLLWALEIIIWLVFIIKSFKKIPEKRKKQEKEQEFKKYIP